MKNNLKSLERKLEKPNWKQLLPVYGIYQLLKDRHNGKPTFMDETLPLSNYLGFAFYQGASIFAAIQGIPYLYLHHLAR